MIPCDFYCILICFHRIASFCFISIIFFFIDFSDFLWFLFYLNRFSLTQIAIEEQRSNWIIQINNCTKCAYIVSNSSERCARRFYGKVKVYLKNKFLNQKKSSLYNLVANGKNFCYSFLMFLFEEPASAHVLKDK